MIGRASGDGLFSGLLCAGHLPASKAGYARLPGNLVKGGLLQVANIPGHAHVPAECPAALRS